MNSLRNRSLNISSLSDGNDSYNLSVTHNSSAWLNYDNTPGYSPKYALPIARPARISPPRSCVNVAQFLISHELKRDMNNNNFHKKTADDDGCAKKYKVLSNAYNSCLSTTKNRSPEYVYESPGTLRLSDSYLASRLALSNTHLYTTTKQTQQQEDEELINIKLFYQKKIGELESMLEKRGQKIIDLKEQIFEIQLDNNNKKDFSMSQLDKSVNSEFNKSLGDVEKLVADNERDIMKAKDILIAENIVLKENTAILSESFKYKDEIEDVALKEKEECLAKQKEYYEWIEKLRSEVLEKDLKISMFEKETSKLVLENQRLQRTIGDMAADASETSMAIVGLKSKIDEYKNVIEAIDSNKKSKLIESEKWNKEKLVDLETSMNERFQAIQDEFIDKEAKYKSYLEKHSLEIKHKENEIQCLNEKLLQESLDAQQKITDMEEIVSNLQGRYNLDVTEYSGKLGQQKLEYEEKLKGVLSLHAKIDLEDTIKSLKEQIELLLREKDLLQDELDVVTKFNITCRSNDSKMSDSMINEAE